MLACCKQILDLNWPFVGRLAFCEFLMFFITGIYEVRIGKYGTSISAVKSNSGLIVGGGGAPPNNDQKS